MIILIFIDILIVLFFLVLVLVFFGLLLTLAPSTTLCSYKELIIIGVCPFMHHGGSPLLGQLPCGFLLKPQPFSLGLSLLLLNAEALFDLEPDQFIFLALWPLSGGRSLGGSWLALRVAD